MKIKLILVAAVVLLASGCASPLMVDSAQQVFVAPTDEQAQVVFMRSSSFGGGIQSTLFDISDDETKFIGILSTGKKIAYTVDPGKRVFMVVSEAADFMEAILDGGRTYYAMVTPRIGAWSARFSLKPVRHGRPGEFQYQSSAFQGWLKSIEFVENTPASHAWAAANLPDVISKRAVYWEKWQQKSASDRAERTLYPDDGL